MKHKLTLLLIWLFVTTIVSWAQQAIGEWRTHLSYHYPTRCEQAGNKLFIVANGGLYSYDKEDNSIETYSKLNLLSDSEIDYIAYNADYRTLIITYSNGNIDLLTGKQNDIYNLPDYKNNYSIQEKKINHICFYQNRAFLASPSGILDIDLKRKEVSNFYQLNKNIVVCHAENNQLWAATENEIYTAVLSDNLLDKNNWKNEINLVYNDFITKYQDIPFKTDIPEGITPNSPLRNYPYYLNFAEEKLLLAGGGQIADRLMRQGTILTWEEEKGWNSFEEKEVSEHTNMWYMDINCVTQNPKDNTHHFAASAGEGLYEFKEGKFVNWYSQHNSPLESALPEESYSHNYVRVNGLVYDKENNLWMANCEAKHPIHVLKPDGKWKSFELTELSEASNIGRTIIDKRGWLWVTSSRIETGGLFCLNTNKSIDNTADDQHRFRNRFTIQDGTLLEQRAVYCIAEDLEGNLWIGTNKGPLVLTHPERFFDENFYCTQIKIAREDNSGLADLLLSNEVINAIVVDGANQKWIGTENNGIFLISPDGEETIQHFTTENSPLPSNDIWSLTLHPRTGELFVGTGKGLISYQGISTPGAEKFEKEAVYAFPNPVRPEYTGIITITGLMRDSNVKITTIKGELVYEGTSSGGQFTWNGCDRWGRSVSSGVYMVLIADQTGKEGIATKITVIR